MRKLLAAATRGADDRVLRELARQWTRATWQHGVYRGNTWLGFPILQWPTDLLIMQEIICEQRPRFIIETGTYRGGSAVFYASLLRLLGAGKVISVDIEVSADVRRAVEQSPFGFDITLVEGDSAAPDTVARVREAIGDATNILVVLDSSHSRAHVYQELHAYCDFVPVGGYLVVMDTICHDLWDLPDGRLEWREDNPLSAVEDFLQERRDFASDRGREKLLVSYCRNGFLKRMQLEG